MIEFSRLIAGDENAFAALVEETAPALRRYCAGIVLNYDDAEDALQTAYLRFWQKRKTLREEEKLMPFLYRIVYRASIDILRARKLFRPPDPVRPSAEPGFSTELQAAMCELKPLDRALLFQRVLEERDYAELAVQYGKSEATLRKRYERTKKRIAERLIRIKEETK